MSAQILRIVEVEMRREVANCARHETPDVLVEIIQRILKLEICRHQIVARAGDFAFPSEVALEGGGAQHPQGIWQVAESFLREQISAGPGVRLRADTAVANRQLDLGT